MKKFTCILATLSLMAICVFAQENNNEKIRLDLVLADSISTNIATTANTTTVGLRLGLNDNNVGIIAGGQIREAFCTMDLPDGLPVDFYWNANPVIGVELWNWEILGGIAFRPCNEFTPYASICYNMDLIKPEKGVTDRLSLKIGAEYYVDNFEAKYGVNKDKEYAGIGAGAVDILSIFLPKISVGLQYSFGCGF